VECAPLSTFVTMLKHFFAHFSAQLLIGSAPTIHSNGVNQNLDLFHHKPISFEQDSLSPVPLYVVVSLFGAIKKLHKHLLRNKKSL
jgi:hypothetical protein